MACTSNSTGGSNSVAVFDFTVAQGATFSYKLKFSTYPPGDNPDNATPSDLSTSKFYMQVRTRGTNQLLLDLTEDNGRLSREGNILTMYVPASDMANVPAGSHAYDLKEQNTATGHIIVRLTGSFMVAPTVTQVSIPEVNPLYGKQYDYSNRAR